MTRLEIQTYVLNMLQANASGAGAGVWTASEIQQYIRDGELKLFVLVADKNENFFSTSTTLSEVAGVATINLPTNLYRILYLERVFGNGATSADPQFIQPVDRNVSSISMARGSGWPYSSVTDTSYPSYYMMQGQKTIELLPAPTSSSTDSLRLSYIARPAAMAGDTHVPFQITAGVGGAGTDNLTEFHDIIALYAIEKCLLKEEAYPQMDRISGMRRERERELTDYLNRMQVQAPRGINVTPDEWSW